MESIFPFNNLIKIPRMAKGGNQGDERHNLTSVDTTSMHGHMEPHGHWNKAIFTQNIYNRFLLPDSNNYFLE